MNYMCLCQICTVPQSSALTDACVALKLKKYSGNPADKSGITPTPAQSSTFPPSPVHRPTHLRCASLAPAAEPSRSLTGRQVLPPRHAAAPPGCCAPLQEVTKAGQGTARDTDNNNNNTQSFNACASNSSAHGLPWHKEVAVKSFAHYRAGTHYQAPNSVASDMSATSSPATHHTAHPCLSLQTTQTTAAARDRTHLHTWGRLKWLPAAVTAPPPPCPDWSAQQPGCSGSVEQSG